MDAQALSALEFDVVLERLAEATSTPYGAERARALRPAVDAAEIERRHALTSEAVALLDNAAEPPLQGIGDVRSGVDHAARSGVLTPRALATIADTIEAALRARAALDGSELAPRLWETARAIDPRLAVLAAEIRRCVDDDGGGVRDTASPLLRRLRKELREAHRRVEEALQKLARSARLRPHLQETFVAERGGRPVLAVKASSRGSVAGIVHDASGSGQTLFVEPFEIVELNNRQSEMSADERDEVERLLVELSAAVAEQAGALAAAVEAVALLDLAIACGAISRGWRGSLATLGAGVRLTQVRHPLLDGASVVPIDLELDGLRALVISGPNTGGKTVALKTLGLAVLLHQSGLRVPALEAELPIFDRVLVEIGDQQSIAMSLSSFSAHVRNLIAILDEATSASLVLIDEPASGTDPVEGAALAQALLGRLANQVRLAVVTTHYPELKEWASGAELAANAATAIDPETHAPLYTLVLGRAGTSHALQTAERLGLDPAVVELARAAIEPARQRVATLLAEAEAAEHAAAADRAAAADERSAAKAAQRHAEEREAALAAEVERVRASAGAARERAVAEAREELAAAQAELASLRDEIRAARRLQRRVERAPDAEPERDRRLGRAGEHVARASRELRRLDEPLPVIAPLAIGDPVEASDLGVRGTIVAIDGDEAEVAGAAGQRVRIALGRLRPSALGDDARPSGVTVRASTPVHAADTIDVRGRTAHEAQEAVRVLVDDAAVAGLRDVRVVHGRGTGVLRKAVRDELRRHPLVDGLESDAADGATVATLAS